MSRMFSLAALARKESSGLRVDQLSAHINFTRLIVERDYALHVEREIVRLLWDYKHMATYKGVFERLAGEKAADAKACDDLIEKLDAHAKRRPEVVSLAELSIKQHLTDQIDSMERDLASLANSLGEESKDGEQSPKS